MISRAGRFRAGSLLSCRRRTLIEVVAPAFAIFGGWAFVLMTPGIFFSQSLHSEARENQNLSMVTTSRSSARKRSESDVPTDVACPFQCARVVLPTPSAEGFASSDARSMTRPRRITLTI
jgi:hypothetical protein